jgi:hypothetical protein
MLSRLGLIFCITSSLLERGNAEGAKLSLVKKVISCPKNPARRDERITGRK